MPLSVSGPLLDRHEREQDGDQFAYRESQSIRKGDWRMGTPYPTDHESYHDLFLGPCAADVARYGFAVNPDNIGRSCEHVTVRLENRLHLDTPLVYEIACCITRLAGLQELRDQEKWGPDVIIKAFDDLDQVLFRGALRHRSSLQWRTEEDLERIWPGMMDERARDLACLPELLVRKTRTIDERTGLASERQLRIVDIHMNAAAVFLAPTKPGLTRWDRMWASLLDAMVRSYIYITVGARLPQFPVVDRMDLYVRRCLAAVSRFTQAYFDIQAWEDEDLREQIKDEIEARIARENRRADEERMEITDDERIYDTMTSTSNW